MKTFNTVGTCDPSVHYMVNIDRQVEAAARLVRQGDYFCINRGRQYGKTTTLAALEEYLSNEYCVFNISFEGMGDSAFASVETVCAEFLKILKLFSKVNGCSDDVKSILKNSTPIGLREISTAEFKETVINLIDASDKPLVVLIDEVDQASNNDGFIKFLGLLRNMFLSRKKFPTFQSVILAGVYDVKNLKLKIRSDEDHQYNSPWNIAVPFNVPMNLPAEGIAGMLDNYADEHNMQFDTAAVGQLIYDYTSGYPFLVSRLCQIIDENKYDWNKEGTLKAVNLLLKEGNTLFDDMQKKLTQYPNLARMLREIIFSGQRVTYNYYDADINIAVLFNFVTERDGAAVISCRIFETWLYSYFISNDKGTDIYQNGEYDKPRFIHDGSLDMRLLLERFCIHFN